MVERLGLATGSVERQHQLAPKAFPEGVLTNEGLDRGDQFDMSSKRKLGIDSLFEGRQAKLTESEALALSEGRRRKPDESASQSDFALRGLGTNIVLLCG